MTLEEKVDYSIALQHQLIDDFARLRLDLQKVNRRQFDEDEDDEIDSGYAEFENRFPIKELDKFLALEKDLEDDKKKDLKLKMIKLLKSCGATDGHSYFEAMLKGTLDDVVLREYSYEGVGGKKRKPKRPSKDTNIWNFMITLAVRKYGKYNYLKIDAKKSCQEWLKHAKTRDERAKKKAGSNGTEDISALLDDPTAN
ncbi:hypothetical protein QAD02_012808 [Eretmocerus hayati]|uniref:Uncharacterized protein n=1 Tax=Eretmocerus hayati TaxID=131215 RepID=A0ACC2P2H0_9HYME|nr:hypothetical protein QAD02_012808 [Eretmocerus hayati]